MDPTLAVALAALAGTAGTAVLTYRASSRATNTTARLGESAEHRQWLADARAEAREARQEAQESRDRAKRIKDEADTDVARLRQQLTGIEDQLRTAEALAARLADTLTSVAAEVWRPEPDVAALRRLVGRPHAPGINGRSG